MEYNLHNNIFQNGQNFAKNKKIKQMTSVQCAANNYEIPTKIPFQMKREKTNM